MAWGYSLSCLQENSSREKHAALSVSLCSSSQKQRGKSERHIHQLPAFFFLTALPFDTFSFFLFITLCNLSTLFTGVSAMIPAEIADNWNRQLEVQKWSYSPVSVGYKSREHHLHPKHRYQHDSLLFSKKQTRNLLLWFLVFLYTVVVWVKLVEKKRVCLFIRKEKKCVLASYTKMCFSRTVLIHLISQDINPLLSVRITPARESTFYWKQVSFRFVYSVCCWLFLKKEKKTEWSQKCSEKQTFPSRR